MAFEEFVASHNADYFLREFTYSRSRFRSLSGQEFELCDGAIWIDPLVILFQMKERDADCDSGQAQLESKWFDKKISRLAVDQLVDSVSYLQTEKSLPLVNMRGQTIDISGFGSPKIHKVVLYSSSEALPNKSVFQKGRQSQRIGFVHFIHIGDYMGICNTLHTPFEIADYLEFRQEVSESNQVAHLVSEKALLGKYLSDTGSDTLASDDEVWVDRLIDDRNDFNIGRLLENYLSRIVWGNSGNEYHAILAELAKLRRGMLKLFRARWDWQ